MRVSVRWSARFEGKLFYLGLGKMMERIKKSIVFSDFIAGK